VVPQLRAGRAVAVPCASVAEWWPRHRAIAAEHADPIHQAIVGGFVADRVAWAFASGYQAALRALFSDLPPDRICALCVTEDEGNSPRAIRAEIARAEAGWVLNGAKRWTTLGPEGGLFLVAAREAGAGGERPALRVARVPAALPGVTVEPMPPARFVPEVPHARVHFRDVVLPEASLLPGDGWDEYVKPFRTVEDIHVHAAVLAYLMREAARFAWPEHWIERASALLAALTKISDMPYRHAETHVALAGALAIGAGLAEEAEQFWNACAHDPAALRWRRDRELLDVASQARAQRTRRAWQTLRVE